MKTKADIRRAVILSTGDELTSGRTLDTNAAFVADKLAAIGIDVVAVIATGDYEDRIAWAWNEGMRQAELVVSTGGLGPTADDLTTETVARLTRRRLIEDENVATHIRNMFAAMKRDMPANNLKQARFPEGAVVVENPLGTAPGFRLSLATEHGRRHLIAMPGVPREMKRMFAGEVLPWIAAVRGEREIYASHSFQTFGISESALDERLAGCIDPRAGRIAFRAAFPNISVRLTVTGTPGEAERRLEKLAARIRARITEHVYAEGEVAMEEVVGNLLREGRRTLAAAESCTGGLIGHRITSVPGSSAYFLGDIVAYANAVKIGVLGVPATTLERHGAVSEETAAEMAKGTRRLTGADIGLATTGIAGPDGGTPDKPVGTVCVALSAANADFARLYHLWGTRDWIKLLTSQVALDWVRWFLLGRDPRGAGVSRR